MEEINYEHYKNKEFETFAHREGLHPEERLLVDRYLSKEQQTLDAGTGGGRILHALRNDGFANMHAYDFLEAFVRVAKGKDRNDEVGFVVADAVSLPYVDGAFDQVLYLEQMLCQLNDENRELATQEAYRILRPGGEALFSFLSFESRSSELVTNAFVNYLKLFRRLARSDRSAQSQPWLKHRDKLNLSALLDKPPYVYWYRVSEAVELLQRHGFDIIAATSRKQALAGETVDYHQLYHGDVTGKLYLVAAK